MYSNNLSTEIHITLILIFWSIDLLISSPCWKTSNGHLYNLATSNYWEKKIYLSLYIVPSIYFLAYIFYYSISLYHWYYLD